MFPGARPHGVQALEMLVHSSQTVQKGPIILGKQLKMSLFKTVTMEGGVVVDIRYNIDIVSYHRLKNYLAVLIYDIQCFL